MNPITQLLNVQSNPNNNILSMIAKAKKDPEGTFNDLMRTNPEFRNFVDSTKGKTADQIAKEKGIDMNTVNSFLK